MTRAQQDRLVELLELIARRHDYARIGSDRLLREAATYQDAEEALALLRSDS